jgi:hypothetical protein
VVVRHFFHGSERQRKLYAHQLDDSGNGAPAPAGGEAHQ